MLQFRYKLASGSFQKQHLMDKITLINFHRLNTEELKPIDLLEHNFFFNQDHTYRTGSSGKDISLWAAAVTTWPPLDRRAADIHVWT